MFRFHSVISNEITEIKNHFTQIIFRRLQLENKSSATKKFKKTMMSLS